MYIMYDYKNEDNDMAGKNNERALCMDIGKGMNYSGGVGQPVTS